MNKQQFARFHKRSTGHALRDEQVTGDRSEFVGKSKAELLAECRAHDAMVASSKKQLQA